jgi:hypothetical protein
VNFVSFDTTKIGLVLFFVCHAVQHLCPLSGCVNRPLTTIWITIPLTIILLCTLQSYTPMFSVHSNVVVFYWHNLHGLCIYWRNKDIGPKLCNRINPTLLTYEFLGRPHIPINGNTYYVLTHKNVIFIDSRLS